MECTGRDAMKFYFGVYILNELMYVWVNFKSGIISQTIKNEKQSLSDYVQLLFEIYWSTIKVRDH